MEDETDQEPNHEECQDSPEQVSRPRTTEQAKSLVQNECDTQYIYYVLKPELECHNLLVLLQLIVDSDSFCRGPGIVYTQDLRPTEQGYHIDRRCGVERLFLGNA